MKNMSVVLISVMLVLLLVGPAYAQTTAPPIDVTNHKVMEPWFQQAIQTGKAQVWTNGRGTFIVKCPYPGVGCPTIGIWRGHRFLTHFVPWEGNADKANGYIGKIIAQAGAFRTTWQHIKIVQGGKFLHYNPAGFIIMPNPCVDPRHPLYMYCEFQY